MSYHTFPPQVTLNAYSELSAQQNLQELWGLISIKAKQTNKKTFLVFYGHHILGLGLWLECHWLQSHLNYTICFPWFSYMSVLNEQSGEGVEIIALRVNFSVHFFLFSPWTLYGHHWAVRLGVVTSPRIFLCLHALQWSGVSTPNLSCPRNQRENLKSGPKKVKEMK